MQLDNKKITYINIYNTFFKLLNNDVSTVKNGINDMSKAALLSEKNKEQKKQKAKNKNKPVTFKFPKIKHDDVILIFNWLWYSLLLPINTSLLKHCTIAHIIC